MAYIRCFSTARSPVEGLTNTEFMFMHFTYIEICKYTNGGSKHKVTETWNLSRETLTRKNKTNWLG